jgi:hypothetical protein
MQGGATTLKRCYEGVTSTHDVAIGLADLIAVDVDVRCLHLLKALDWLPNHDGRARQRRTLALQPGTAAAEETCMAAKHAAERPYYDDTRAMLISARLHASQQGPTKPCEYPCVQ